MFLKHIKNQIQEVINICKTETRRQIGQNCTYYFHHCSKNALVMNWIRWFCETEQWLSIMGPSSSTVGSTSLLTGDRIHCNYIKKRFPDSVCSLSGCRRMSTSFCGSRMCAWMHLFLSLSCWNPPLSLAQWVSLFQLKTHLFRLAFLRATFPLIFICCIIIIISNILPLAK